MLFYVQNKRSIIVVEIKTIPKESFYRRFLHPAKSAIYNFFQTPYLAIDSAPYDREGIWQSAKAGFVQSISTKRLRGTANNGLSPYVMPVIILAG